MTARTALAMGEWWDDLGDDELLRRLVQRGVPQVAAMALVGARDRDERCRVEIARRLAR